MRKIRSFANGNGATVNNGTSPVPFYYRTFDYAAAHAVSTTFWDLM